MQSREPDPELDELVERFNHRVCFFACRVERRFGLAGEWQDDLVSSGYLGLLKALRNRRGDAHPQELSAYVSMRIEGAVIDEARRILARLSNQTEYDPEELETGLPDEMQPTQWRFNRSDLGPEDLADQTGRWRSIERAIEHLGADHRELLLAYASGQSLAEIARRDGLSPARLQNQLTKISRGIRARSPELRRLLRHEI
jgi:RNA polymerase sigma factor (sigma-70 family)